MYRFIPLLKNRNEIFSTHPVRQVNIAGHFLALAVEVTNEYNGRKLSGPHQLFSFGQRLFNYTKIY